MDLWLIQSLTFSVILLIVFLILGYMDIKIANIKKYYVENIWYLDEWDIIRFRDGYLKN